MSLPPAIKLDFAALKLAKSVTSTSQEDKPADDVLTAALAVEATKLINTFPSDNLRIYPKYRYIEVIHEDIDGAVTSVNWQVTAHSVFSKLFEGVNIADVEESVAKYLFSTIIGWDNYFNCPVIILHDTTGAVVDIIKYRPSRIDYDNPPKYLQKNNRDKPTNRGNNFLYPFQVEMEQLIKKNNKVLVGEGIKNSVNALIRSVPFISMESVSNAENPRLIAYIDELSKNGVQIWGTIDGDVAGEKAFNKLNAKLSQPIKKNLVDFNSNIDFTDYLRKEKL